MHGMFDFLMLERCFHDGFCENARPYPAAGTQALATEYPATSPVGPVPVRRFGRRSGIHFIFRERELVAGRFAC